MTSSVRKNRMGYSCYIKNCKSEWKRSKDVAFHSFPSKAEFCEKFIAAIPPPLRRKVCKYSKICSKHFTTDCFQPTTSTSVRRILKRDAIPTLFDYDFMNERLNCDSSNINTVVIEDDPQPIMQTGVAGRRDVAIQTMPECSGVLKKDIAVQLYDNTLGPSQAVTELRQKVKVLQKRLLRREARLTKMMNVIEKLKKHSIRKQLSIEDLLRKHFTGFSLSIVKNELQNSSVSENRKRYSEEIRDFALKLYSYSPKGYKFVRSLLNLPHDSMLRKWLIKTMKESDSGLTWRAYMDNLARSNISRASEPASHAEMESMARSDDSNNIEPASQVEMEQFAYLDDSRDSGSTTNVKIKNAACLDDSMDSGSTSYLDIENMEICLDESTEFVSTSHVEIENIECSEISRDCESVSHVEVEIVACSEESRDSGITPQIKMENVACSPSSD